jgi:hypothetical protein
LSKTPRVRRTIPVADAARRIGVTPSRVRQLLDSGKLAGPPKPGRGRSRFVYQRSLNAYLRTHAPRRRAVPNGSSGSGPRQQTNTAREEQLAYTQEEAELLRLAYEKQGQALGAALEAANLTRQAAEFFAAAGKQRARADEARNEAEIRG